MDIAHPDALKVMWDGCVVTKLTGKVSRNEMVDDMFFRFKNAKPFQLELYSTLGAYNKAYNHVLIILILGSIVLTIYHRLQKLSGARVSIIKLFTLLLIVCAIGFGISYAMVGEKVDVYPHPAKGYWYNDLQAELADFFADPDNHFSNGSEFIEVLRKGGVNNPITGEPMIIEQSPGNIVVEEDADEIAIKVCLENGSLYSLF